MAKSEMDALVDNAVVTRAEIGEGTFKSVEKHIKQLGYAYRRPGTGTDVEAVTIYGPFKAKGDGYLWGKTKAGEDRGSIVIWTNSLMPSKEEIEAGATYASLMGLRPQ